LPTKQFSLPILSAKALEKSLNKLLKPMGYQFPDLLAIKCTSGMILADPGKAKEEKFPGREAPAYPPNLYPDYGIPAQDVP
jgi:hypothetical protein